MDMHMMAMWGHLTEADGSNQFSSTAFDSNPSGYLKLYIC
jgi:hypothetical protein